ncbi:hypothetical protein C8R46DRAFT_1114867 [Mycena filopes]|nr:hypothetical protein C8R46DRAFT_1114867 [Mycena filopes]
MNRIRTRDTGDRIASDPERRARGKYTERRRRVGQVQEPRDQEADALGGERPPPLQQPSSSGGVRHPSPLPVHNTAQPPPQHSPSPKPQPLIPTALNTLSSPLPNTGRIIILDPSEPWAISFNARPSFGARGLATHFLRFRRRLLAKSVPTATQRLDGGEARQVRCRSWCEARRY